MANRFLLDGEDDKVFRVLDTNDNSIRTIPKKGDAADMAIKALPPAGQLSGATYNRAMGNPTGSPLPPGLLPATTGVGGVMAAQPVPAPEQKPLSAATPTATSQQAPLPPAPPSGPSALDRQMGAFNRLSSDIKKDAAGTLSQMSEANEERQKALMASQVIGEAQAAEEAAYHKQRQADELTQAKEAQYRESDRKAQMEQEMARLRSLQKEVDDAKIQPWSAKSFGERITVGIAAGLMFAGATYAGQSGAPAIAFLQGAIDRDLETQKAQLQVKKDSVANQSNLVAVTRGLFDDERSAEAAARAIKWKAAEAALNEMIAKNKGLATTANAGEMAAQIQAEYAKEIGTIQQNKNQQLLAAQAQQADIAAKQDELRLRGMVGAGDTRLPGMSPTGEKKITEKDQEAVTKQRKSVVKVLTLSSDIKKWMKDNGTEWSQYTGWTSNEKKVALGKVQALKLALKEVEELGAITGPDMEMLNSLVPENPASFWTSENEAVLDDLGKRTLVGWRNTARQHGYSEDELGVEAPRTKGFEQ